MAVLDRYLVPDAYVLLDLQRRYETADVKGKIALLEDLTGGHKVPYEVELLAVEDSDVQVRQWIARNGGNLKYTSHFRRTEAGWVHEEIEPTFYHRLINDPDPLVRASLWENPQVVGFLYSDEEFASIDRLARLALMRNSELRYDCGLIKKIFDPDDNELNLDKAEREDLILAFLTNTAVIKKIEEEADLTDAPKADPWRSSDRKGAIAFLDDLWNRTTKWPTDKLPAPVPPLVYTHLPASDDTRTKIYKTCPQRLCKNFQIDIAHALARSGAMFRKLLLSRYATAPHRIQR